MSKMPSAMEVNKDPSILLISFAIHLSELSSLFICFCHGGYDACEDNSMSLTILSFPV